MNVYKLYLVYVDHVGEGIPRENEREREKEKGGETERERKKEKGREKEKGRDNTRGQFVTTYVCKLRLVY